MKGTSEHALQIRWKHRRVDTHTQPTMKDRQGSSSVCRKWRVAFGFRAERLCRLAVNAPAEGHLSTGDRTSLRGISSSTFNVLPLVAWNDRWWYTSCLDDVIPKYTKHLQTRQLCWSNGAPFSSHVSSRGIQAQKNSFRPPSTLQFLHDQRGVSPVWSPGISVLDLPQNPSVTITTRSDPGVVETLELCGNTMGRLARESRFQRRCGWGYGEMQKYAEYIHVHI